MFRELIANFFLSYISTKAPHNLPQIDFRHFLRDIGDRKRTFAEFHSDYGRNIYMCVYNAEK